MLIISQSRLSIAHAPLLFKCLNMHIFMYATPTLTTEALHLVTQVQAAFSICYSELPPYKALANS